uniref:Uncharacterized protein n=1 Tax=Rhizophagus irregularis (strain DAOM 181602 / DAOM 197198 / MUCL 43194) TaxID=747089 RepID=U9SNC1_RHIID
MSSFFTDYQFEHGLYNSSIGVDVNCTMLATSNAKFHIRLLPSRWYCTNVLEPFLVADKMDFREENLTAFEQKVTYGKIHGIRLYFFDKENVYPEINLQNPKVHRGKVDQFVLSVSNLSQNLISSNVDVGNVEMLGIIKELQDVII